MFKNLGEDQRGRGEHQESAWWGQQGEGVQGAGEELGDRKTNSRAFQRLAHPPNQHLILHLCYFTSPTRGRALQLNLNKPLRAQKKLLPAVQKP